MASLPSHALRVDAYLNLYTNLGSIIHNDSRRASIEPAERLAMESDSPSTSNAKSTPATSLEPDSNWPPSQLSPYTSATARSTAAPPKKSSLNLRKKRGFKKQFGPKTKAKLQCGICKMDLGKRNSLNRHMEEVHGKGGPRRCCPHPMCKEAGKTFSPRFSSYIRHIIREHGKLLPGRQYIRCPVRHCQLQFDGCESFRVSISNHLKNEHQWEPIKRDGKVVAQEPTSQATKQGKISKLSCNSTAPLFTRRNSEASSSDPDECGPGSGPPPRTNDGTSAKTTTATRTATSGDRTNGSPPYTSSHAYGSWQSTEYCGGATQPFKPIFAECTFPYPTDVPVDDLMRDVRRAEEPANAGPSTRPPSESSTCGSSSSSILKATGRHSLDKSPPTQPVASPASVAQPQEAPGLAPPLHRKPSMMGSLSKVFFFVRRGHIVRSFGRRSHHMSTQSTSLQRFSMSEARDPWSPVSHADEGGYGTRMNRLERLVRTVFRQPGLSTQHSHRPRTEVPNINVRAEAFYDRLERLTLSHDG